MDRKPATHPLALVALTGLILFAIVMGLIHAGIREAMPFFDKDGGLLSAFAAILTLLGGSWGVWLLYLRTKHSDETVRLAQLTFQTSERSELAGRFAKAIELLESEHEAVRVGGVLMLRDVARADIEAYELTVIQILQTFIEKSCREAIDRFDSYNYPPEDDDSPTTDEEMAHWQDRNYPDLTPTPDDVVKAFEVIGDAKRRQFPESVRNIRIKRMVLVRVALEHCDFSNVVLKDSYLVDCSFDTCLMDQSVMAGTILMDLKFHDCSLTRGTWKISGGSRARRNHADMSFWQCDLGGMVLNAADVTISRSNVTGAHIEGVVIQTKSVWHLGDEPYLTAKRPSLDSHVFDAGPLTPSGKTPRGMLVYVHPKSDDLVR